MSNTNTGGPAFPHTEENGANSGDVGMTLRDYFAAKAMQGLFASDTRDWNQEGEWEYRAITSYKMADAMLKVREA